METPISPVNGKIVKIKSPKPKISRADIFTKGFVITCSTIVLLFLVFIVAFIGIKSSKLFNDFGFFKFIFYRDWHPGINGDENASYGIGLIILSTLMMLFIALLIAIPLAIFASLFITEYLSKKTQKFVITFIQLLAGIPSVVFGLFALNQIGPMFVWMGAKSPQNLMTASFTLAFMVLPTIITLSINSLMSVPDSYRFASLGLGITKERTTFGVVLKNGLPGIITAIIIGVARVIGETMAVILIAGNSTNGLNSDGTFQDFIFSSIRTLAGTLGLEMLENHGTLHESALYAIGLVLFILVIIINLIIIGFSTYSSSKKNRHRKVHEALKQQKSNSESNQFLSDYKIAEIISCDKESRVSKKIQSFFWLFFMITSTMIICSFTSWIIVVVFIKGISGFDAHSFVEIEGQRSGIFASLFVTILLIMSTILFAIPLSLIVAIFLSEFAHEKSKFKKTIMFSINVLSSTPSIVFGVFGLTLFIVWMKLPMSIFASSLTMTIVILPTLITSFQESLKSVPDPYKEAAYGMGLSKTAVLFRITLPNSTGGMLTGLILGVSRIIGESAPVYLTLGTSVRMPTEGFLSSGATLTTQVYMMAMESNNPNTLSVAYQISMITIALILLLNYSSKLIQKKLHPEYKKIPLKVQISMLKAKTKNSFSKSTWTKIGNALLHKLKKFISIFNFKNHAQTIKNSIDRRKKIKNIINEGNLMKTENKNIKVEKKPIKKKTEVNSKLVQIKDFNFYYKNFAKQSLKNINLDIKEKTITTFIGPSGCGKSTLLRSINRMNDLIEDSNMTGEIIINDKSIYSAGVDVSNLRTEVGMVFQKPNPFPMSIYDNVAFGPRNKGIKNKEIIRQIVEDSLKKASLWDDVKDILRDSALGLSGGQQQRLCIARAIAMRPKILLMDEPTSALDPIATLKIEELVVKLKEHYTIIMVTHSMAQATRISDYTAFFLQGELIEHSRTKKMFINPKNQKTEDYISGRFG